jgi:hypothetical protein
LFLEEGRPVANCPARNAIPLHSKGQKPSAEEKYPTSFPATPCPWMLIFSFSNILHVERRKNPCSLFEKLRMSITLLVNQVA